MDFKKSVQISLIEVTLNFWQDIFKLFRGIIVYGFFKISFTLCIRREFLMDLLFEFFKYTVGFICIY